MQRREDEVARRVRSFRGRLSIVVDLQRVSAWRVNGPIRELTSSKRNSVPCAASSAMRRSDTRAEAVERLLASLMSAEKISCCTTSACAALSDPSNEASSATRYWFLDTRRVPSVPSTMIEICRRVNWRKGYSRVPACASNVGIRPMARRLNAAGAGHKSQYSVGNAGN